MNEEHANYMLEGMEEEFLKVSKWSYRVILKKTRENPNINIIVEQFKKKAEITKTWLMKDLSKITNSCETQKLYLGFFISYNFVHISKCSNPFNKHQKTSSM